MSKKFIKLTLNFEYEREILINTDYLINVVEYEDFTLVKMNDGDKYEVKECANEISNLIEGKQPEPINVPWTNPVYPTDQDQYPNFPQPFTGIPYWTGTPSIAPSVVLTDNPYCAGTISDTTQLDMDNTTITSVNTDNITTLDINHF